MPARTPSLRSRARWLVGSLVALAAGAAPAAAEGLPWRQDLAAAKAEAAQAGKLVLIHFWTESCGPCRLLEKRVFASPGVAAAITKDYVPVKVNARVESAVAEAYGVTRVPTDAVVTPEGQLVKSFVSPPTPMAYVGLVSQLAAVRRSGHGAFDKVAAAAPDPRSPATQPVSAAPPVNPVYSQFRDAAVAAAPAATPPVTPVAPPATPPATAGNPTTPTPAPSQPTVARFGFDGYCPVTMKREWRWAEGDAKWGAIHRGTTYLFVSAEARDAFLASPDEFSPALAGADAVLAVETRQSVPGTREHAVEYEGRFFFFTSEQTLGKFWNDPAAYARGAERVAAALPTAGVITR